jgi:hypothetical protein
MQERAPTGGGGLPVIEETVEVVELEPEPQQAFKHVRYNATVGRTCGPGYTIIDSYTTCVTAARWTNAMPVANHAAYQTIFDGNALLDAESLPLGCIKQNYNRPTRMYMVKYNPRGNASSTNDQWDVICQQSGACALRSCVALGFGLMNRCWGLGRG